MISLIHPSRGRALKAANTLTNWMTRSYDSNNIEQILSIDSDDPEKDLYYKLFHENSFDRIIENDTNSVVAAANSAAKAAKGDILIYLSDDFDCPIHWDKLILQKLILKKKAILRINDCSLAHKTQRPVLTMPIMTKGLYNELGYFFYPEYKSMFCDNDLFYTTQKYLIQAYDLKFPHLHHSEGRSQEYDDTYKRSEANWNQGKEIFNRRSKELGWHIG